MAPRLAPLPRDSDNLVLAVEEAVAETQVARAGYRQVSTIENSLFNLLTSFSATFVVARWVTYLLRRRSRVGPFRSLRVGRRHVHHFVPGIVIAFAAGTAAIISRDEALEPKLAVPFGIGMGLTLDESALLLEFEDVYWSSEGLLSVQITLAVMSILSAVALALRFLRRGEWCWRLIRAEAGAVPRVRRPPPPLLSFTPVERGSNPPGPGRTNPRQVTRLPGPQAPATPPQAPASPQAPAPALRPRPPSVHLRVAPRPPGPEGPPGYGGSAAPSYGGPVPPGAGSSRSFGRRVGWVCRSPPGGAGSAPG